MVVPEEAGLPRLLPVGRKGAEAHSVARGAWSPPMTRFWDFEPSPHLTPCPCSDPQDVPYLLQGRKLSASYMLSTGATCSPGRGHLRLTPPQSFLSSSRDARGKS